MPSKMLWSADRFPMCSQNCFIVEKCRSMVFSFSRGFSGRTFAVARQSELDLRDNQAADEQF
jgi:Fe-S oxidoreductase